MALLDLSDEVLDQRVNEKWVERIRNVSVQCEMVDNFK